jgi:hypothetical protein
VKQKKSKLLTIFVFLVSMSFQAHNHEHDANGNHSDHNGSTYSVAPTAKQLDSLLNKFKVKQEHAAKFGRLIIQDAGGRMKPINTFRQSYCER